MWLAVLILSSVLAVAFIALAASTVYHYAPEDKGGKAVRSQWPWFAKGLAFPILVWVLMNIGFSQTFQPFMPQIQRAQIRGKPWLPVFFRVTSTGVFVVSSYWSAITMASVLMRAGRRLEGEPRSDFKMLCVTSLVGMGLPAAGIIWAGGLEAIGLAAMAVMLPIAGYGPGLLKKVAPPPMYSRAIAKMKFGKYTDAEMEIIKQLEGRENDYQGWLMLATLYAEQFKDLPGAEEIIMEICDQPRVTPTQLSVALHKLADWQLNIGNDPEAAERALLVIPNRLPGTHLARMAEARRQQLPRSVEELQERKVSSTVPLPSLSDDMITDTMSREEATARASKLSNLLTQNPNDTPAREKLARLLAEHLSQPALGIGQIELLLGMHGQPDNKRAEWLALIATWKHKFLHDEAGARETLERIIKQFPNTPQAFAAQRRLNQIKVESQPAKPPPRIVIRLD